MPFPFLAAAIGLSAVGSIGSMFGLGKSKGPPAPKPIDLQEEQRKALAGNKAILPELEGLATGIDAFNQQRLNKGLDETMPGARANAAKVQSILADQLAGRIGDDVLDNTQNQASARGLTQGVGAFGTGGSLTSNNFVKQLGLTGIDLQQRGMTNEAQWLQVGRQNLMAPQYDFTSMFVTPAQQAKEKERYNDQVWDAKWLGNQQDNAAWQGITRGIGQLGGAAMAYGLATQKPPIAPGMDTYSTSMGRTLTPSYGNPSNLNQPFAGQNGDSYDFFWRGIGNS